MNKQIGMVGIGMMGHGIATNLVRKGFALCVLEHAGNQPLDQLKAAGATSTDSAARAGSAVGCDHPVRHRNAAGGGGAAR